MSDGGIRMDFLELRVQTLEKYLAALAKWTNFNPQQNITENDGTGRGFVANDVNPAGARNVNIVCSPVAVNGGTSVNFDSESTPGNVQNNRNQEGSVEPLNLVLVGAANGSQQVNPDGNANQQGNSSDAIPPLQSTPEGVELTSNNNKQSIENEIGIDIPQGNSDETLPQNPNPEGDSFMELEDQLNEDRETSTAAGGSVDGGADQSKDEAAIPPQIKTEADAKLFYIKEEHYDSEREEDNSATSAAPLESLRKQPEKSTRAKSSTSGSKSLNKLASNSRILSKKKKIGENTNNLKCPHCLKAFHSKSQLEEHTRIHTKPLKCPHCPYSTARERDLKGHNFSKHPNVQQTLSGQLKDSSWRSLRKCGQVHCYFCAYRTNRPDCLVRHIRTHTGEEPYSCPRCPFVAKDSGYLKLHFDTHCK